MGVQQLACEPLPLHERNLGGCHGEIERRVRTHPGQPDRRTERLVPPQAQGHRQLR